MQNPRDLPISAMMQDCPLTSILFPVWTGESKAATPKESGVEELKRMLLSLFRVGVGGVIISYDEEDLMPSQSQRKPQSLINFMHERLISLTQHPQDECLMQ